MLLSFLFFFKGSSVESNMTKHIIDDFPPILLNTEDTLGRLCLGMDSINSGNDDMGGWINRLDCVVVSGTVIVSSRIIHLVKQLVF